MEIETKEYKEGQSAFASMYLHPCNNPYPINSDVWKAWNAGWKSVGDSNEYYEGYDAFPEENPWDNPYEKGTLAFRAWEVGYTNGHAHGGP